ncbi:ribose 5-phosphate isomerase B [Putridiphycobacter roseus]|uniref:Ribose 5-phosphate isomerase B n=1 Tax=Putridiphycobacter roseus TaxID=2219161 RepID=A0A2W1MYU5_9FLAO|nr:ribose 5-phosphate isomerase B [Putridiphycobacter roseus]PZE16564.1 ribose 5-phosphate isomerase B [Putridiphycobacter roseus]
MTNIIPIGNDHAGYELKVFLSDYLTKKGYSIQNFGCDSTESIDYPDYGHKVAKFITENTDAKGIVICGSGNGINMTVNKHQGVRSALCWTVEIAKLARQHNDANIIALPARFISKELAVEMVDAFFNTEFEGGRHQKRVDKIALT